MNTQLMIYGSKRWAALALKAGCAKAGTFLAPYGSKDSGTLVAKVGTPKAEPAGARSKRPVVRLKAGRR